MISGAAASTAALTPKEAPAATGEREAVLALAQRLEADADYFGDLSAANSKGWKQTLKDLRAAAKYLRAQPQAHEEAQPVGWVKKDARHVIWWGAEYPVHGDPGDYDALYTTPPSQPLAEGADAEKLRVAVEALEYIDGRKSIAPVWVQQRVRSALAALQQEGRA